MSAFDSEIGHFPQAKGSEHVCPDAPHSRTEIGDTLELRVAGTMHGHVTEVTQPGLITVTIAQFEVVMTYGDGPGEWREVHPGSATGDLITGRVLKPDKTQHPSVPTDCSR